MIFMLLPPSFPIKPCQPHTIYQKSKRSTRVTNKHSIQINFTSENFAFQTAPSMVSATVFFRNLINHRSSYLRINLASIYQFQELYINSETIVLLKSKFFRYVVTKNIRKFINNIFHSIHENNVGKMNFLDSQKLRLAKINLTEVLTLRQL